MNVHTVTVTRNFKTVVCGTVTEMTDNAGNPRFLARDDVYEKGAQKMFWSLGGAMLSLQLSGLLAK